MKMNAIRKRFAVPLIFSLYFTPGVFANSGDVFSNTVSKNILWSVTSIRNGLKGQGLVPGDLSHVQFLPIPHARHAANEKPSNVVAQAEPVPNTQLTKEQLKKIIVYMFGAESRHRDINLHAQYSAALGYGSTGMLVHIYERTNPAEHPVKYDYSVAVIDGQARTTTEGKTDFIMGLNYKATDIITVYRVTWQNGRFQCINGVTENSKPFKQPWTEQQTLGCTQGLSALATIADILPPVDVASADGLK